MPDTHPSAPQPSSSRVPAGGVRRRRRWPKVAAVALALVAAGALIFTGVLAYDAPCPPPAPAAAATSAASMRAITYACYGSADVLRIATVERPRPAAGQLLVRVHAASVNPTDWHFMRGSPHVIRLDTGVGRPAPSRLGVDFSGLVEAVGEGVTDYAPGDAVFGSRSGSLAEYVTVRTAGAVVRVPRGLALDEAAAVPVAAVTALQALRDKARVRPGQRVLINGASGGVGTFAVQIAKALGTEVTGVSSTRNLALVKSLGADHTIDYTREDFTTGDRRYDVIIDAVGNRSARELRRVLTADGVCVLVGGGGLEDSLLGPLFRLGASLVYTRFVSQSFVPFFAVVTRDDLTALSTLLAQGAVKPVIDRRYPFEQAAEAIRYLEAGRARGKVLVTMAPVGAPASR